MLKKLLYLLLFILIINSVSAATIHGAIYSFDLDKQPDTIVTVNSVPEQTIVSKDGTYSFELDLGEYEITATYTNDNQVETVTESIKIQKQGSYTLDLILFPSFEQEDLLFEKTDEKVDDLTESIRILDVVMFLLSLIGFGIIFYIALKYRKSLSEVSKEIEKGKLKDKLQQEVVEFIKEKGGRTTQKEIRKHFPSSEAKISLVISELEHKKVIEKIKKGRGNIIVLS